MKNITEFINESRTNTFESTLKKLGIEVNGPDSAGITYICTKDAKEYEGDWGYGIAPSMCLCYSYKSAGKYFTFYIDDEDGISGTATLVTKYSKDGQEYQKQIKVKDVLDLTKDKKAYACTKHNAEVLANILINKKLVKESIDEEDNIDD